MTGPDDDVGAERKLAELLARYDEQLAAGPGPSDNEPTVPGLAADAADRLRRAQECLRLLEQARPRRPAAPGSGLEPDALVAHYRIARRLGGGGMGVVYRARDTRLGRDVALKFLPEEYADDPQRLARFLHEARTASALNHPQICTVHELGQHAGRLFLVMEFIEGRTLKSLVGERLGVEALAQLVGQAARALAAAHAAGVVHRDVKPENVMVRDDGYVKVLDFGLARRLPAALAPDPQVGPVTDPGTVVGTLHYMAPEQARAQPVESSADVFSLGVVLYELATGRHPFLADSPLGVLTAIAHQTPVRPSLLNPAVGPALESLIERMLAKDPRGRPAAAEVDVALAALAGKRAGWPVRAAPAPGARASVGRQAERAALRAAWEAAGAGRGSVLCVTGEPGIGKTTLVEDFLAEVAADGRPCAVARGRCSDPLAGSEAYQPFLEALEGLLRAPGGEAVGQLLRAVAPTWAAQLTPPASDSGFLRLAEEVRSSSQPRLRRELTTLLEEVARRGPVLLFLDDFHWADVSTVDLLAHLGGRCREAPLLLVLTYRPTELLLGNHPFQQVRLELQARGACAELALDFLGRDDVDAYLDRAFPGHALPPDFAALVHARTGGNPLFLVDLLRYLREGGVIAPVEGRWALAGSVPDLENSLPQSVRSLLQRKLAQLSEADRRLLAAASVQGQEFDSAVVARVLGLDAAEVEERLEQLGHVHGLVRLVRGHEFPDRTLNLRYAFLHMLYHSALHASLQPTRRASLSAATARALLQFHAGREGPLAGELAVLFEIGRDFAAAAEQFRLAAGNAARVFAHQEAVGLARRGLEALGRLPDPAAHAACELRLLMRLGPQLQVTQGFAAPEVEQTYLRAQELCEQVEGGPRFAVLWGLWLVAKARSDLPRARPLAVQLLWLAEQSGDPGLLVQARQALAVTSLCQGDPDDTRRQMEAGLALHDLGRQGGERFFYGQDPGVACLAFGSVALWLLGRPDQAVARSAEALRLADGLGQPSSRVLALHFAAMLRLCRREVPAALEFATAAQALGAEHGFSFWSAGATVLRGAARAAAGDAGGLAELRQGLAAWAATGSETYTTYYLALLAEALWREGQLDPALAAVGEAKALAGRTGEWLYEAELHRLHGELTCVLRGPGAADEAEASFLRAREVARRQQARLLELRAACSLARLWRGEGRSPEAVALLSELLPAFSEGLDTPDLVEAADLWGRAP